MKITLASIWKDPDDGMIEYECAAEIPGFRGVTTLYGDGNTFAALAAQLLRFPFESQEPIVFEAQKVAGEPSLRIDIKLREQRGLIDFRLQLRDEHGNAATLNDSSVEAQALHDLATALQNVDFTELREIVWDTHTYSDV